MNKIYGIFLYTFIASAFFISCKPDLDNKWDPYEHPMSLVLMQNETNISYNGVFNASYIRAQKSTSATFTIKNTGADRLVISSIALSGEGADQFGIDTTSTDMTVSGRKSTTFDLICKPDSIGIKTSTVTINSNDPDHKAFTFTVSENGFNSFGTLLCDEGKLYNPQGIGVDADGNVYVADTGNNRIQKFAADGSFLSAWGTYGSAFNEYEYNMEELEDTAGQFSAPVGIAVSANGDNYVADYGNYRIQKFNGSGQYFTGWYCYIDSIYSNLKPGAIAIDSGGNVYIVSSGGYYDTPIIKFDPTGSLLTSWGGYGTGDGQFTGPSGVAVSGSNTVYVVDSSNYNIQKFSSDGAFISKWGSTGGSDGTFDVPISIALDSSENVYVGDHGRNDIQKFDSDGNFILKFGGDIEYPDGIALYNDTFVYVTDYLNDRIMIYNTAGVYQTKWETDKTGNGKLNGPNGIAVDSSGNIYVADTLNHRVQKFDFGRNFLGWWGYNGTSTGWHTSGAGASGSSDGQFNEPVGIAVDADDYIYVTDCGNNRVQKFNSIGVFQTKWGTYGTGDGQMSHPKGIAIDNSGSIYVADTWNNRIQQFDLTGLYLTKWGAYGWGEGQFNTPVDIAIGSAGNVYVADSYNRRIQIFDSAGNYLSQWVVWPDPRSDGINYYDPIGLSCPSGLEIDNTGNVYIVDEFNKILVIGPDGTLKVKWDNKIFGGVLTILESNSGGSRLTGIAMSPSGRMYMADFEKCLVIEFVPDL